MVDKKKIDHMLLQCGMHPDSIVLDAELEKFKNEMTQGLEKKDGSSLLMLPTYIAAEGDIPRNRSAVVIDAGGTNLRVALVCFDDKGLPNTEYFEIYPMPGSIEPVTKDEMFDAIAKYTLPIIKGCDKIGFCFSYVFESTPDRDGKVHAVCKEVSVSGVEGVMACAELEAAYKRCGAEGTRSYVMLNDTVATLLGAKAVHGNEGCDSYVGFILGTGQNACYVENTCHIKKLPDDYKMMNTMIVNMESGVYTGFVQGSIDKDIDGKSQYPGDHVFEKMISGGYFGDVIYGVLKLACTDGLFSAGFFKAVSDIDTVSLREITAYIVKKEPENNFYEKLVLHNDADRNTLDMILDLLYERAAKMLVVMFCAIAEEAGFGENPESPLRICAEGTTYYKSPLLLKHIDILLKNYAAAERGRHISMVKTANATLIGTALAAIIN